MASIHDYRTITTAANRVPGCKKEEQRADTVTSGDWEMQFFSLSLEIMNANTMQKKTQLSNQVLELQHTLEDLSTRVDTVKEENKKLKSENQVLGQYIENLMSASSVFQMIDTKSKRK
uniref:Short coiled-coil protein n=1 Tax=Suricata suricatta TaxID=37032 RepID=A0A673UMD2_SURSU